ncbi:hypothetical protein niasHS_009716 [Heterodera schachtii]|uniref:Uncharacterized protein n=1 Tax=Heterodera schachtii TaxID=97005 RepID=A0ABD2J6R8_HETSC
MPPLNLSNNEWPMQIFLETVVCGCFIEFYSISKWTHLLIPFAWNRASYSAGHFNAALNQLRDGIIEEDPDLTAYSEYLERIVEQMQ